jgi:hypothetical protein
MFIELTEILRCPRDHEPSYMICVPMEMNGRDVVRGGVSCPVCSADFPIINSVVLFAQPRRSGAVAGALTAEAAVAFSGIGGPGGYLALVGSAARLAGELLELMPGVQLVLVNPPPGAASGPRLSVLSVAAAIPLKQPSIRAAIVGADALDLVDEAASVVLPGLRLVVESELAGVPGGELLARGAGVSVFEMRKRKTAGEMKREPAGGQR